MNDRRIYVLNVPSSLVLQDSGFQANLVQPDEAALRRIGREATRHLAPDPRLVRQGSGADFQKKTLSYGNDRALVS
jgi:hypothetical protein